MREIKVLEKPRSVSWEEIKYVMDEAHNAAKGNRLDFPTSTLNTIDLQSRIEKSGICFVAMDGNSVIGTLSSTIECCNKWYAKGETVAFRYVAVLPEYSGLHIADKLYHAGFEYALKKNIDACIMTMSEFNSHHLHVAEKSGFCKVDYLSYKDLDNNSIRVAYWIKKKHSTFYCGLRFRISKVYVQLRKLVRSNVR